VQSLLQRHQHGGYDSPAEARPSRMHDTWQTWRNPADELNWSQAVVDGFPTSLPIVSSLRTILRIIIILLLANFIFFVLHSSLCCFNCSFLLSFCQLPISLFPFLQFFLRLLLHPKFFPSLFPLFKLPSPFLSSLLLCVSLSSFVYLLFFL
jgi:hypothetical protein